MLVLDPLIAASIVGAGAWGWRNGTHAARRRYRLRHRGRQPAHRVTAVAAVAGALACACAALLAGTALVYLSASGRLRDSIIVAAVLPEPDHGTSAAGPAAASAGTPVDRRITTVSNVLRATRSVVRLRGSACGRGFAGSGWVAHDGIIVTNAHVVAGQSDTTAQVGGSGRMVPTTPIWFEPAGDIALLRAPALMRTPGLRLADRRARRGTRAAVLGFPLGGPLRVLAASIDGIYDLPAGERIGDGRSTQIRSGAVTRLQSRIQAGSSGSAVVDVGGRVLTTVFATDGLIGYGVPNDVVRNALRHAGPPVDTGGCG